MEYVHGHAACLRSDCPLYGLNQAECCSGETSEQGFVATSDIACGPALHPGEPLPPDPDETSGP
ncbi:MAG: hypothetical protein HMLKMBBP_03810 [Planctomycetes bacterium]|nr:hypothetical protein [Planctomycetota bacterium]